MEHQKGDVMLRRKIEGISPEGLDEDCYTPNFDYLNGFKDAKGQILALLNSQLKRFKLRAECPEFKLSRNSSCLNLCDDSPFCIICINTGKFGYTTQPLSIDDLDLRKMIELLIDIFSDLNRKECQHLPPWKQDLLNRSKQALTTNKGKIQRKPTP